MLQINIGKDFISLYDGYSKKEKKASIKKQPKPKIQKISSFKKLFENKVKDRIKLLTESNIDFSKFGWVNEAAKLIGIAPQKVSNFMKKHMSEFYETKCFKRKSKTT